MDPKGFDTHDHQSCIASGVRAAEAYCAAHGLQMTPVRRRVLTLLLEEHRAMGAYDILEVLRDEGLGAQPPVAYRALNFLARHGFVHKIEQRNAFVACAHPGNQHTPVFLICSQCDVIAETALAGGEAMLASTAGQAGFTVDRAMVELEGVCPNCSAAQTGAAP